MGMIQEDDSTARGSVALAAVGGGLHARVLDQIGVAICNGELVTGTVLTVEEIETRYRVSRSVVREVVRVLESMGLARSRRRVGMMVLPSTSWNLFDPQVIRWKLASPSRLVQLQELTQLRTAIEPLAARLAAERSSLAQGSDLMGLAGRLWAAGHEQDDRAYVSLDILFHGLVLTSSGNEMFARLDSVVGVILRARTDYGYVPAHPHAEALQLHVDVASAIQRRDADLAHDAMLRIMNRATSEMTQAPDVRGARDRSLSQNEQDSRAAGSVG